MLEGRRVTPRSVSTVHPRPRLLFKGTCILTYKGSFQGVCKGSMQEPGRLPSKGFVRALYRNQERRLPSKGSVRVLYIGTYKGSFEGIYGDTMRV